jgi:hypothetical protein
MCHPAEANKSTPTQYMIEWLFLGLFVEVGMAVYHIL